MATDYAVRVCTYCIHTAPYSIGIYPLELFAISHLSIFLRSPQSGNERLVSRWMKKLMKAEAIG